MPESRLPGRRRSNAEVVEQPAKEERLRQANHDVVEELNEAEQGILSPEGAEDRLYQRRFCLSIQLLVPVSVGKKLLDVIVIAMFNRGHHGCSLNVLT